MPGPCVLFATISCSPGIFTGCAVVVLYQWGTYIALPEKRLEVSNYQSCLVLPADPFRRQRTQLMSLVALSRSKEIRLIGGKKSKVPKAGPVEGRSV